MATQNHSTLKLYTLTPPTFQAPPCEERYQIIIADNGDRYVLDRIENKLYPIVQPVYQAVST